MKVHILDKTLEYENNIDTIDTIFDEINNIVKNSSKILSYLIVDSIEVYEDFYDYFLDNIKAIEEVKVIALTYEELVNDILISAIKYIRKAQENIEELSNSFYKSPDKESWEDLSDLLGGVSWIINTFASIDKDPRLKEIVLSYESWNLYAQEVFSLQDLLGDFEESLVNNDNVTIADILLYEILPIFEEMEQKLFKLVKTEENLNDLN